jgi:hypothetical protein
MSEQQHQEDIRAAGEAARRMSLREAWQDLTPQEKRRAAAAATAAGALLVTTAAIGVEKLNGIDYAPETTTYIVDKNDGWYDVVESIPGIDSVDKREVIEHIKADPANIDAVTDGLKPGQSINVPISVAP